MNTTIRHICHLLRDRDDLAVPGLGVFRRRRVGARFEGSELLPPSEEIVFVAHDSYDDDVLVMSVARCLACDKNVAAERVAADVADIKTRLGAGMSVELGDSGKLVPAAALGGIVFEPSASWNSRQPFSWLKPVERLAEADEAEEVLVDEETEKRRNIFMQSLQRTASSAAAVALLALIAFVASQLPRKNAAETQMASFGFERAERPSISESFEQAATDKALVLIINTPVDGMSIVDPSEKKPQAIASHCDNDDSYFLIVASLASSAEAYKFIAANADTPGLGILEADGRCRVYAASGATFAAAKAHAESEGLFERFPAAWICRK